MGLFSIKTFLSIILLFLGMSSEKNHVAVSEEKLVEFWKKNNIFEKSVQNKPKAKQYVFYDGPPFATGLPHYGHILGLTSKDLFPRYWTMKGFRVDRRWGWDCHGLPIENLAEKELGIKEKKEIEAMGIGKFNEFCRSKVLSFAGEWKKTVDRMGKWIEFDNSYKTMDQSYMETVWYLFKRMYDEGYVYEGKKVLLFCPHCQTPLAKSEIAMDKSYKTVTEKTATVKFKLKDEDNTFILAWTTTPWTLIGNVALAVSSKLTYVKIQVGDEFLVLAKERLEQVTNKHKVVDTFKGDALIGKEYEMLYAHDSEEKGHYILEGGDEVSADEGTGIIHMAIYGEFDYEMIKKYKLPVIQHVGPKGLLVGGPEKWIGTWFKKADKLVLEELENRNLLFSAEDYTHPYPFCYRCATPLFYNAVDSWFVNIQKIKPKLLERNKDINWSPSHIKEGRFKHILETAPDWTMSRNRYWATSMPIWKCETCEKVKVVGSVKELQEKAVEKIKDDVDLHKHVMDEIHLKCDCGEEMSRVPEVFDCWFESASMPYAERHYPFENKEEFITKFPGDFVSEYVAQTRAWFYYMHVVGVILFDRAPFKNVVVSGNVRAADGAKMSKSKKNFSSPHLLFDKYGADAVRFYLMTSPLMRAEDLNFKDDGVKEVYRKVVVLLQNVSKFLGMFAQKGLKVTTPGTTHVLDRWIVSQLHLAVRDTSVALDEYNTFTACTSIQKFIDRLSTWFVRRSRDRFKSEDVKDKKDAIQTLAYCLHTVSKLLAPIAPFVSEQVHQNLREFNADLEESVHLTSWPVFDEQLISTKVNENMVKTREVVSLALDAREKSKVPIRQVLASLEVVGVELEEEYLDLIADEVNVKKVLLKKGKEVSVSLDTNITRPLLLEGVLRDLVRKVNNQRKKLGLTVKDRIVLTLDTKDKDVLETVKKFNAELLRSIQADEVKLESGSDMKEIKVNKQVVLVGIKVV
jgi:isoleucyl-tRNA synthetase